MLSALGSGQSNHSSQKRPRQDSEQSAPARAEASGVEPASLVLMRSKDVVNVRLQDNSWVEAQIVKQLGNDLWELITGAGTTLNAPTDAIRLQVETEGGEHATGQLELSEG